MNAANIEHNMELIDRFLELTEVGSPEHEFLVRAYDYHAELLVKEQTKAFEKIVQDMLTWED